MKTTITKNFKGLALSLGLGMVSFAGFSQEHITLSMENITASSNAIEYDLYVTNDGTTSLKLSACAFGINYNSSILNGTTATEMAYACAPGSRSRDLGNLRNYSLLNTSKENTNQLRLTMKPTVKAEAINLQTNVPYKVGHFRFTNNKPWAANSNPAFSLNEFNVPGLSTSCALAYINNDNVYTGFSVAKKNLRVQVANSPILNPASGNDATATLAGSVKMETGAAQNQTLNNNTNNSNLLNGDNKINIYPNPTQDMINIDLYAASAGNTTVKVSDIHGRTVKQIQARAEKGYNTVSVSLLEVPSGVYSVQVFQDNQLTFTDQVTKKD